MPTNTISQSDLDRISDEINEAIDSYSVKTLSDEPRNHLGMSEIGKSCLRQLYYKFHWCKFDDFDGRMLRLFKRGHREEERFVSILEGIGCKVERFDKNGKQFRAASVMGHYGGSCDGRAVTPWMPNKVLLEFKTYNTNSFSKYATDKGTLANNTTRVKNLIKTKPEHIDQMNSYGYFMNLEYALYFPENKNDDDIRISILKLDHNRGRELELRAESIITAEFPPEKISDNASYFECRYCLFKGVCHDGEIPIKNCRSCRLSKAVENAEWYCSRWQQNIPKSHIALGCPGWTPI